MHADRLNKLTKKIFRRTSPVHDDQASTIAESGPSPVPVSPREDSVNPHPPSQPLEAPAQMSAYHHEVTQNASTPSIRTALDGQDGDPSPSQVEPAFDNSQPSNNTPSSPVSGQMVAKGDLWQQAFEQLSEQQKQKLLTLSRDANGSGPDHPTASGIPDLIAQARARQEECEKKAWRIKFGKDPAKEIILRDQTALIISWLTKAGDIGVQFAPTVVTQVWPCVKAILKIPVEEANQMAALLTVADKVSRATARGGIYETVFTPSSSIPTDALGCLHDDLVALYKACLELLEKMTDLLKKNVVSRASHSLLHPDAVKEAVTAFSSLEEKVAESVQAASAALSVDLLQQVRHLEEPVARIDKGVSKILESVTSRDEQDILEWISPVPYHGHHGDVVEKRMADTCDWLLRHPKFRAWDASGGSILLWLQGHSGTGKTFLTSKVIDRKISLLGNGSHDEALAFFYFSRGDSSRNTALSCLQSLVRQLSKPYSNKLYMRSALKRLCEETKREGWGRLNKNLGTKQLEEAINSFPRVTIILDALDKCQEGEDGRRGLIQILEKLMESSSRPLLVFVSSQPDGSLISAFRDCPNVEVGVEDNQDDIAKFVEDKVLNADEKWDDIPTETRDMVVSTLLEKSQGMFRWAALQVYELLELSLVDQVEARLGKLPEGLEKTYDEIYQKSSHHDPTGIESKIIDRAIMWVMAAREPLDSTQILSAVRLDPVMYVDTVVTVLGRPVINQRADEESAHAGCILRSKISEKQLLGFCANLLTVSSKTGKWAFAHASVAEYFEQHYSSRLQAHAFVGSVGLMTLLDASLSIVSQEPLGVMKCLTPYSDFDSHSFFNNYEKSSNIKSRRNRNAKTKHPFLEYAICRWAEHMGFYDESLDHQGDETGSSRPGKLRDSGLSRRKQVTLLKSFIGDPNDCSPAFRFYLRQMQSYEPDIFYEGLAIHAGNLGRRLHRLSNKKNASFTVVGYGLFNLLRDWWPGGGASERSAPRIDTSVRSDGWSLLHIACCFNRAPIVEALICAASMDPSEKNQGRNAFFFAFFRGHVEVCRILIEKGKGDRVQITKDIVKAVTRNSRSGKNLMALFFNKRGN